MSLMETVNNIAEKYQMPVIYSPTRGARRSSRSGIHFSSFSHKHEALWLLWLASRKNAYCVLSPIPGLCPKSAMLDFPGVLIRTSTERPEVLDKVPLSSVGITGKKWSRLWSWLYRWLKTRKRP